MHLPGVGKNLQDRYEVSVMHRMAFPAWSVLDGATFTRDDPQYKEWKDEEEGVYTSNGALLAVVLRSSLDRPIPDLFCYVVIAPFTGYFPGYSAAIPGNPNTLTWVVLKGHTNNTAGSVTLRSADPRDPPAVHFRYFEEGNDSAASDLTSVVDGIAFVRKLAEGLKREGLVAGEESPGEQVSSPDDLRQFVTRHRLGPPRVVHLPDWRARRRRRRVVHAESAWHDRPADRGRVDLPAHPGPVHRRRGVYGGREGRGHDPRGRWLALTSARNAQFRIQHCKWVGLNFDS